jgi:K(+)-stimulated pyrophosphate-energized sodium pump
MSPEFIIIAMSILAILTAVFYTYRVVSIKVGGEGDTSPQTVKLKEITAAIADGAMAFLIREYKVISIFIVFMAGLIYFLLDNPETEFAEGRHTAFAFVVGATISCICGFIGMKIATMGNVRTAQAAKTSLSKAFTVAFDSGAVMGFGLIGLAILGIILLFMLFTGLHPQVEIHILMESLAGYGLGGSSVALFGRVGGGIYTKAADVGADLVGKVEKGIPEDDPRNPATIADNVGDNVGDIAGMGADLFGSAAEATCAALVIGATAAALASDTSALLYPVLISAFGIPASLITTFFARIKENGNVERALKLQLWISTAIVAVTMYFVTDIFMVSQFEIAGQLITKWNVYTALLFDCLVDC